MRYRGAAVVDSAARCCVRERERERNEKKKIYQLHAGFNQPDGICDKRGGRACAYSMVKKKNRPNQPH